MNDISPLYSNLMVFGRKGRGDADFPETLGQIIDGIRPVLEETGRRLKFRGRVVDAQKKNVAPRAAIFKAETANQWVQASRKGSFESFEFFDEGRSEPAAPWVYGSIRSPFVAPGASREAQPACCLSLALRHGTVEAEAEKLEQTLRRVAPASSVVYAFIERAVPWEQKGTHSASNLLDYRWFEVRANDFRNGLVSMREFVAQIYWANLVAPEVLKNGALEAMAPSLLAVKEMMGDSLYLRFKEDPQADPELQRKAAAFFQIVPPRS